MSGGIHSIFSIAHQARKLKHEHGYDVVVMTRPIADNLTYIRNTHFKNSENVFRFDQLRHCDSAKEVYIHMPEYLADTFYTDLSDDQRNWLQRRERVDINLLNQNIRLMPPKKAFQDLFQITPWISQSVAHHAYFTQDTADKYGLPCTLLPAYTDLSAYPATGLGQKENLIIYSPDDESAHRAKCLERIQASLPEYRLVEINGISFDEYMDLATRCKFSISFGEGFDGYVAQPIHQGGIGITVYNEEFFPDAQFLKFPNFFASEKAMVNGIVSLIRDLSADPDEYTRINREIVQIYDSLYSLEDYVARIRNLTLKNFDLYPHDDSEVKKSA